ncbi:hypothetical protein H0H81_011173, partial [Sphagnurus paluster]
MMTLHPFNTPCKSVLLMWSVPTQQRHAMPDTHASVLFVLLHGMPFTNIQREDRHAELEGLDEFHFHHAKRVPHHWIGYD